MTDPDLAKAIEWMGRPTETNWHDLWKAFEVLRHAAGGNRPFAARFGLNQADLLSFRSSANDPETSGDHARHAVQTGPKGAPMSLDEGRAFVGRIIAAW